MANLVNMKLSSAEAKAEVSPEYTAPEYPYGLRVELNTDALERLGLPELPDVGTPMQLLARVEVCSVSAYENADQEKQRSLSLQITDLALAPERRQQTADEFYASAARGAS